MAAVLKITRSSLEDQLAAQIKLAGLPEPVREYRFAPLRRWRLDYFWPVHSSSSRAMWISGTGVEVQGGLHVKGRHVQGASLEKEYEKLNAAAEAGIAVYFATAKTIKSGEFLNLLERVLR